MNRAFSKIWMVVILLIFIAGGIFAYQYFGAPEEVVEDETADWESYQSGLLKFSIKYPEKWFIEERKGGEQITLFEENNDCYITIDEYKNPKKLPLTDVVIDSYPYSVAQDQLKFVKESIGQYTVYRTTFRTQLGDQCAVVTTDETKYVSLCLEPYDPRIDDKYSQAFNQMLSTFRFIEVDETADWKTYRNEEYEFEVKYPENWEMATGEELSIFPKPVVLFSPKDKIVSLHIYIIKAPKEKSLKEYLKDADTQKLGMEYNLAEQAEFEIPEEEIEFLNLPAIRREEFIIGGHYSILATYLKRENLVFKFEFYPSDKLLLRIIDEDRKLNNQMLATFRFLPPK